MADKNRRLPTRFTAEQAKKLLFATLDDKCSDSEQQATSDEEDTNENLANASHTSSDVESATSASEEEKHEMDVPTADLSSAASRPRNQAVRGGRGRRERGRGAQGPAKVSPIDGVANGPPGGGSRTSASDVYKSKNGDEIWQKKCSGSRKYAPQNVMKLTPGPTAYATRHADTVCDAFQLFLTPRIVSIILGMTNKEGKTAVGETWKPVDEAELNAYFGLLFLAGVYRSAGEATEELWDGCNGCQIFRAVMSRQRFHEISRVLRFDNKDTRSVRRSTDRLAPIREMFDMWVETLSKSFVPYENVTVDEQLVPFRGRCSFRQYMKSKLAKYGLKLWVLCDASTSYALNLQVYTGRVPGEPAERNQGERVVHDMVEVIKGSGQ